MSFVAELWEFLNVRKKFWLMPILILMLAIRWIDHPVQAYAVAPFIYTLF